MALPTLLFGIPAALGVPWLVGDNLIQNYPLRTLVGTDLRHGHLPLWNPFLWSGTPLLAGFSAGAAYPGTALFALLPDGAAWAANQAAPYALGAIGMLAFLRALHRSWTASALGAVSFAWAGFMAVQSVHIDLVQAGAWLPWALLALDRLAHRADGRSPLPWLALLAAALGLMILTGAVEPVLDGAVVLIVYTAWLAWRTPERRAVVLAGALGGVALGLLLGAAQLLPGSALQAQSQRAAHTYQYFTSGSMNKSLTILGLDPLLLGVDHSFPLTYYGTYNLPEISSYAGILPVMAAFGLLARRNRRSRQAASYRIWYVIGVVGLLLTWGSFTPLGHLLYHVPLFDRQRLLARNLLLVDLSLCVLLAFWVDLTFRRADEAEVPDVADDADVADDGGAGPPPTTVVAPSPRRLTSDVVLALVPVAGVVGLQLALVAGGTWFPHVMHVPGPVTRSTLWPLVAYLSIPTGVAVASGALVLARRRLGSWAPALLAAVVLVDLVVFNTAVQVAPDAQAASSPTSTWANEFAAQVAAAGQGPAGGLHRMAVFNPDRYYPVESDQLGEPDLTLLRRLDSIQGYGALVSGRYETATDTHTQMTLDPASLGDGTYARLDLGVLATVPEYLLHLVVAPPGGRSVNGGSPLPPVPPDPAAAPDDAPPPPTPASDFQSVGPPPPVTVVAARTPRTWFFGTVLGVRTVTVPGASPAAGGGTGSTAAGVASLGLVSADGRHTTWVASAPVASDGTAAFDLGHMVLAAGIVVRYDGPGSWPVRAPVVDSAGQGVYRLDGSLAGVLQAPQWRFAGMTGVFPIFVESGAAGRAWVTSPGAGEAPVAGAVASVVSSTPWGEETIRVTTPVDALVVRNVQFATGWQATRTAVVTASGAASGGAAVGVPVVPHGLVQAVRVPAGTSELTFVYRPHRVVEGLVGSTLGLVAIVVLAVGPALVRRRRPARSPAGGVGEPAQGGTVGVG